MIGIGILIAFVGGMYFSLVRAAEVVDLRFEEIQRLTVVREAGGLNGD